LLVTSEEKIRRLRRLYDRIPAMRDCRGLCADSCYSPFDVSELEQEIIAQRAFWPLQPGDGCSACSMLTADGRCHIYDDRPVICRVFGAAPSMRCEHGCSPVRWLTDGEAAEIICEVFNLSNPGQFDAAKVRRHVDRTAGALSAVLRLLRDS
jgi:Fe-S-cluster containining protein